tara:strand:- start:361 stop:1224 length:864 start_codon:yes stop_codon:yes gene_type:complete
VIQFTDEQMRKLIKEETEKFLNSPYDESFDLVLNERDTSKMMPGVAAAQARRASLPRADRLAQQRAAAEKPKATAAKAATTTPAAPAAAAGGGGGAGGSTTTSQASPDEPKGPAVKTPKVDPAVAKNMALANKAGRQTPDQVAQAQQKTPAAAGSTWGDKLSKFNKSDLNTKGGETATKIAKNVGGALKGLGYGAARMARDAVVGTAGTVGDAWRAAAGTGNPVQKLSKKAKKAGLGAAEIASLHQAYQSGAMSEKQIATLKLMERCLKSGKVRIVKENKKPIIIDV